MPLEHTVLELTLMGKHLRVRSILSIEIDAHNFDEIEAALENAKATKDKPTAIIAKSIKGKGVSFMENQVSWHGAAPNAEQYEIAMAELKAVLEGLEG